MNISGIEPDYIEACYRTHSECMREYRPCLIIAKFKYKGRSMKFAIPLRSNIKPNVPSWQYVKLANTSKTRKEEGCVAGAHIAKMFPVSNEVLTTWKAEQETLDAISENEYLILAKAYKHLKRMERGKKKFAAVDIDLLIPVLEQYVQDKKKK